MQLPIMQRVTAIFKLNVTGNHFICTLKLIFLSHRSHVAVRILSVVHVTLLVAITTHINEHALEPSIFYRSRRDQMNACFEHVFAT